MNPIKSMHAAMAAEGTVRNPQSPCVPGLCSPKAGSAEITPFPRPRCCAIGFSVATQRSPRAAASLPEWGAGDQNVGHGDHLLCMSEDKEAFITPMTILPQDLSAAMAACIETISSHARAYRPLAA